MDCLIRVINGPDQGTQVKLLPGQNIVGRSQAARLRLTAPDVSWEHLVLTRNGDEYYAENLSAAGTWVDGSRISGPVRLRPQEVLRLTPDTSLRLEAVDGSDLLGRRRLLLALAVVIVAGSVGLLALDPFADPPPPANWDKAYRTLQPWIARQVTAGRLPQNAPLLFEEAWRLERAERYDQSRHAWLRMQVLLDQYETRQHFAYLMAHDPEALNRLLSSPEQEPYLSDEQAAAALGHFVDRRLRWSNAQARGGGSLQ
jgi:hypothetical protein